MTFERGQEVLESLRQAGLIDTVMTPDSAGTFFAWCLRKHGQGKGSAIDLARCRAAADDVLDAIEISGRLDVYYKAIRINGAGNIVDAGP